MGLSFHDLHLHTFLSSCSADPGQTPEAILASAAAQGLTTVAFTDHYWDETMPGVFDWYLPQDTGHLRQLEIPADTKGVRVLSGCETEFRGGRLIGLSPARAEEMELIQLPINHFHIQQVRGEVAAVPESLAALWMERLEEALCLSLPWKKTVLSHLNIFPADNGRDPVLEALLSGHACRVAKAFDKAAALGVMAEVNVSCMRSPGFTVYPESHVRLFAMARRAGIRLTWGSDAHHPDGLAVLERYRESVRQLGLAPEDFAVI